MHVLPCDAIFLTLQAQQVHFDPLIQWLVESVMGERVQIDIRAQFVIGPHQEILVEGFRDTFGVVVSTMENGGILHQIDAH